MGLFGEGVKEFLAINESKESQNLKRYLGREIAHLLKYDILIDMRENYINSWANSIFQSIFDINSVDIPSYHEMENDVIKNKTMMDGFKESIHILSEDNDMSLFPSQLPSHYTYEFLKDFDSVRNYMISSANNNTKIINAINSKCEENKKKKIKR